MTYRKKLIEVPLPLVSINDASAKEKGNPFLKGHPRNLHQWWARRPLATCRAMPSAFCFCQIRNPQSQIPNRISHIPKRKSHIPDPPSPIAYPISQISHPTSPIPHPYAPCALCPTPF